MLSWIIHSMSIIAEASPQVVIAYLLFLPIALVGVLVAGKLSNPYIRSAVRATLIAVALAPGLVLGPEPEFVLLLPASLMLVVFATPLLVSDPSYYPLEAVFALGVVPLIIMWIICFMVFRIVVDRRRAA